MIAFAPHVSLAAQSTDDVLVFSRGAVGAARRHRLAREAQLREQQARMARGDRASSRERGSKGLSGLGPGANKSPAGGGSTPGQRGGGGSAAGSGSTPG